MMGEELLGKEPFSHVYINGTILDKQGRKMSKSLGNGIDPVAMIEGGVDENTKISYAAHGADGIRFSLTTLSTEGQDLKLWPEQFEDGQRFLTKLWNAGRFTLGNIDGGPIGVRERLLDEALELEDRWILARVASAVRETTDCLEGFRYCDAAQRVRSLVWGDFCDWYVEAAKFRFAEDPASDGARVCRHVLVASLDVLLRLLHPFCPFITEELWQLLGNALRAKGVSERSESIMIAPWPEAEAGHIRPEAERAFELIQEVVRRVRKIRQERNLTAADTPEVLLSFSGEPAPLEERLYRSLGKLESVTAGRGIARPASCAVEVLPGLEIILPVPAADPEKETVALEKKKRDLEGYLQREEGKLRNPSFVEKAPAEVVEGARKRVEEARAQLRAVEEELRRLRGGA